MSVNSAISFACDIFLDQFSSQRDYFIFLSRYLSIFSI